MMSDQPPPKNAALSIHTITVGVLALPLLMCCCLPPVLSLFMKIEPQDSVPVTGNSPIDNASTSSAKPEPKVGDLVTICNPDGSTQGNQRLMVRTLLMLEEMQTLVRANDDAGLKRLMDADQVISVTTGEQAKLIEKGASHDRVEMQTGPNSGKEGWIEHACVK